MIGDMAEFLGFHEICCREYIIFVTIFLLVRLLVSHGSFKKSTPRPISNQLLPFPPGLPFWGNLFAFKNDMRDLFAKWTDEIGGIFRLRIGPVMDIVVVNDLEAIREAFVEKAEDFSDRMIPPIIGAALGQRGSFIWPTGDGWKKTRKFGHSAFRTLGVGQRSMENKIIEEARLLVQTCELKEGEPLNLKKFISHAVGNVISCLVSGHRFEYDYLKFTKVVGDLELVTEDISLTSIGNIFPLLYYTPLFAKFRCSIQETVSYIKSMVRQHQEKFDPLNVEDLIDLYMAEVKQQREQGVTSVVEENQEWRLIVDIFVAGMVTTGDSLVWAILFVAQQPDLMKEIQKEIDEAIGEERSPKWSDRDACPLTVATLMEVLRIRPPAPLGLPRLTSRESSVQGYHVPKDSVVIMNLWEILNSPKYWNEPEKFNPYRFLSQDGQRVIEHPAFIPFGIGLRLCLGEKLAKIELFIIFASLLQRFKICLAENSRSVGIEGKAGITYSPPKFEIILKKRETSN
ncbi:cytochrome P450 2U1-like [Lytechinus pictus]|uniref:cytochrome P450 2U1-like n=1 Tax=Lytechinus pictus TaxID=7653 RepID=UPI0030BA0FC8